MGRGRFHPRVRYRKVEDDEFLGLCYSGQVVPGIAGEWGLTPDRRSSTGYRTFGCPKFLVAKVGFQAKRVNGDREIDPEDFLVALHSHRVGTEPAEALELAVLPFDPASVHVRWTPEGAREWAKLRRARSALERDGGPNALVEPDEDEP